MAYSPDDDRFYSTLNNGGVNFQKYRDKIAEDQADTQRQVGGMYAQALPNTVNAGMQGANWSMKRAGDQQKIDSQAQEMDLRQSKEGRDVQRFGEDEQDRATNLAAAKKAADYEQAPAEEAYATGAGVDYVPGMTHADVKRMADARAMGYKDRDLAQKGEIAGNTLQGENARSAATIAAENQRHGETMTLDREKIASEEKREGMKLAGKPEKVPPAETLNKLSDADAAQKSLDALAEEYKSKTGKFSGVMQYAPGTDASKYNDSLNVHAQNVAAFLKQGRGSPTPQDIEYAKTLLPTAGDSPERGEGKLNHLSALIAEKKKDHANALQGAGFNVGELGVDASGTGKTYDLKNKHPKNTALGADGGLPPVDQMDYAAVQAELKALRGGK